MDVIKIDQRKPKVVHHNGTNGKATGLSDQVAVLRKKEDTGISSMRELSLDLPGNSEERRSLYYYYTTAVANLVGCFDGVFWERDVLQISHSLPSVRHALLALSSIYERAETHPHTDRIRERDASRFSLEQYNKAICHLVQDIQTKTDDSKVTAPVICLMFAWLEELLDNHLKASAHIIWGLKILQYPNANHAADEFMVSSYLSWPPARGHIMPAVENFVEQVVTGAKPVYDTTMKFRKGKKSGPLHNTRQARISLESNFETLTFLLREAQDLPEDCALKAMARVWVHEGLSSWKKQFCTFLDEHQNSLPRRELRAAVVLQIRSLAVNIAFRSCFVSSEMYFDGQQADFERLIALAHTVIDPDQTKRFGYDCLPDYSWGAAVIWPLYYTTLKCRSSATRYQALNLLKQGPMKEGMWERELAVQVASRVMELEEMDLGSDVFDEHALVGEECRITRVDVMVNYERREFLMETWRGPLDPCNEGRIRKEHRGAW